MIIRDFLKLKGEIQIYKNGVLVCRTPNVVCRVGKERGASHWATLSNANYWFSHVAIGTGTAAASTEDLALVAEYYRKSLTVSAVANTIYGITTWTGEDVDTYKGVALGSGSYSIIELGLLDALSGGNLIARQVVTQVDFTGAEEMELIWSITIE
jgi:hypothetical protein